jgi:hypothetical protein
MLRRNFLGLLAATPLAAALAHLGLSHAEVIEPDEDFAGGFDAFKSQTTIDDVLSRMRQNQNLVRRQVLPFAGEERALGMIEPGRIARLVGMPMRPFAPDRLLTEPGFELLGLSVGGEPQFDVDPELVVPTDLFSIYSPYDRYIRFSKAEPGQRLVMVVRNVSDAPRRFHAALTGNAVMTPADLEREAELREHSRIMLTER